MRDTISTHFALANVMKVGLEILLLCFWTCKMLIETGLRLSLFPSLCHNCFSIWETLSRWYGYPSLILQYKYLCINTCRVGIHIIYIVLQNITLTFWWVREFWKNLFEVFLWQNLKIYIITESWQRLNCFVHSLNLAKKIETTVIKLSQKGTVSQTE